jgi:hypothetical protein
MIKPLQRKIKTSYNVESGNPKGSALIETNSSIANVAAV